MTETFIDPATGEWFGECEICHTSHNGHLPGSMGAAMECLGAVTYEIGGRVVDDFERLRHRIVHYRNNALARYFRS